MGYGVLKLSHDPNRVTDLVVGGTRLCTVSTWYASKLYITHTRNVISVVEIDIISRTVESLQAKQRRGLAGWRAEEWSRRDWS